MCEASAENGFSSALINQAFPALVALMTASVDREALQSGSQCLRIYVVKAIDQIVALTDGTKNGLQHVTL
jgi:hypothetical protein